MNEPQNYCKYIFSWQVIWKVALLLVLCIGMTIFTVLGRRSCPIASINVKEIECMNIRLIERSGDNQYVNVNVNDRVTIQQILDAMRPIKLDWYPAKWSEYSFLVIYLTNGKEVEVSIYSTNEKAAAFSIDRVYYRGGPEAKLKEIIESICHDHSISE